MCGGPVLVGVRGVDHVGLTVPDLDVAHDFFTRVLGCEYLYRLGPFQDDGDWMSRHLGVDDRAVMRRLHFYRLGGQAVFEVFQYEAADQAPVPRATATSAGTTSRSTSRTWTARWRHSARPVSECGGSRPRAVGRVRDSGGSTSARRGACSSSLVSYPGGKAFDHDPGAFA